MKVIGRTLDGGTILEINSQEASLLETLQDAIAGCVWSPRLPVGIKDGDIDKMFLAVRNFVEAKYAINELHKAANYLDGIVGIRDEEKG